MGGGLVVVEVKWGEGGRLPPALCLFYPPASVLFGKTRVQGKSYGKSNMQATRRQQ